MTPYKKCCNKNKLWGITPFKIALKPTKNYLQLLNKMPQTHSLTTSRLACRPYLSCFWIYLNILYVFDTYNLIVR